MADPMDVAKLLSAMSSQFLLAETPATQQFVVDTITTCVTHWETHGIVLDPITREVVLDSLVASNIAMCRAVAELVIAAREDHDAACHR